MRVLRIYHAGESAAHRARDRSLRAAGVDLTLVAPQNWGQRSGSGLSDGVPLIQLAVERPGDVNRHRYREERDIARVLRDVSPDLLDIHEEPFSVAARQWLRAAPPGLPVVMYTAQNLDKRYPPPFARYERAAYRRVAALYPCSRQAAAVARGKGFRGLIQVLPLGYDERLIRSGRQSPDDGEIVLGLFGRLVPEKGVLDAVEILVRLSAFRECRLIIAGEGPESDRVRTLAAARGVADRVEFLAWRSPEQLAQLYAATHVVLVPSRPTETWVEQFGRVIVEGQAAGAIVAGYATGSIPEVAGPAGVLVPVGDTRTVAERIAAVLGDATEFNRRRKAGFAAAASRAWSQVAAKQAVLYRRIVGGEYVTLTLSQSPRQRRTAACREFGPPAATAAGQRPFAVPVLRRGGPVPEAVAGISDAVSELIARSPAGRRDWQTRGHSIPGTGRN